MKKLLLIAACSMLSIMASADEVSRTIYVDDVQADAGQTLVLPVKMKNDITVAGFQFDIVLPSSMSIDTSSDCISLSNERANSSDIDMFAFSTRADASTRVLAASTGPSTGIISTFSGNEGSIAQIKVVLPSSMISGSYIGTLKNVVISDINGNAYKLADTTFLVNAKGGLILGDVNNDGKVSIADVSAVANAILGNPPTIFYETAGDVNQDGKLSISDLTGIANIVLYGKVNP